MRSKRALSRALVAADVDEVAWLECRFGERGPQGMIRLPYAQPNRLDKKLYACIQQGDTKGIAWAFGATFDARREGEHHQARGGTAEETNHHGARV